jgi:hypothetical protein
LPFPTETVEFSDDPVRGEDLGNHTESNANRSACPYCGARVSGHQNPEETDTLEHDHRVIDGQQICRRFYECNALGITNVFYTYQDLNNPTKWTVAKVTQGRAEKTDDSERLQFGRKRLAEIVKPIWHFKTKLATKDDYTDYLAKNLVLGLELEYDFVDQDSPISNGQVKRVFGLEPTEYHHAPECPVCGNESCWNHLPDNLIRGVERDASIRGWEFLVYGSHISSEEFAKRLPLAKFREYFAVNERDGLHVHAMLKHDIARLPNVIVKNLWQLFRYYYPAWVNLFGNYSQRQGFLRRSSYNDHDYVTFTSFSKSPFLARWAQEVKLQRCALYLKETPIECDEMDEFDIEIRTSDASMDLEQLIAVRAMTKAMILRAAQLSNFGLISVESNAETWERVKNVVSKINARSDITKEDIEFMQKHTMSLMKELAPFLTEFERTCVKHLIEKPVRERGEIHPTPSDLGLDMSEDAKHLKKLITIGGIETDTEEAWFLRVAHIMNLEVSEVKTAIRQLKAYFDKETHQMVVVG